MKYMYTEIGDYFSKLFNLLWHLCQVVEPNHDLHKYKNARVLYDT